MVEAFLLFIAIGIGMAIARLDRYIDARKQADKQRNEIAEKQNAIWERIAIAAERKSDGTGSWYEALNKVNLN